MAISAVIAAVAYRAMLENEAQLLQRIDLLVKRRLSQQPRTPPISFPFSPVDRTSSTKNAVTAHV